MKKSILILILNLMFIYSSLGQVAWLEDEKLAKAIATEKDQLILMDFWAIWCGPCKKMDKEMWNTPEFQALSQNFVPLKIDIDIERELALQYNVRSIPHVVLVTVSGDIVWSQTGYSFADTYKSILENIPKSLHGINAKLNQLGDDYDDKKYFDIAISYQNLAGSVDGKFSSEFYQLSDQYFKKITKKSENNIVIASAEMNMLLNDAYVGKYKKSIKKLDKIEIGNNEELADLKQFIKAYCFKCDGNDAAFEKAKETIQSEEYLAKLNN